MEEVELKKDNFESTEIYSIILVKASVGTRN